MGISMTPNQKKVSIIGGWFICILGTLFYCYEYLLRIEPSVMITPLMQQFNITASSFGLVTALYYYAYTPMQLAVGILIDRYGTRLMIAMAAAACALGSFLLVFRIQFIWLVWQDLSSDLVVHLHLLGF